MREAEVTVAFLQLQYFLKVMNIPQYYPAGQICQIR